MGPGHCCFGYNDDYLAYGTEPYSIRFDDPSKADYDGTIEFWGPADHIRKTSIVAPRAKAPKLRFKVGTRVECKMERGWLVGTVIKTFHKESYFETGHNVPYQVQLDGGKQIYAPFDDDGTIRVSTIPPPSCWICFDNEQSETNVILRECACRGEENGFVHLNCLVHLALAKTQNQDRIADGKDNPFRFCITCKQPFGTSSRSSSALAKACYEVHGNDPLGSFWHRVSTRLMSDAYAGNSNYDKAEEILQREIRKLRPLVGSASGAFLVKDMIAFLIDLAEVHQKTASLSKMRASLDEALALSEAHEIMPSYSLNALLGRHAHLIGDKETALRYWTECVTMRQSDGETATSSLLNSAVLNLELGNKEKAIEQFSAVLEEYTTVYGHEYTHEFAHCLRMLRDGLIEKMPLLKIGLPDLQKNLRAVGGSP